MAGLALPLPGNGFPHARRHIPEPAMPAAAFLRSLA
jgi:hypothetical protein